MTDVEVIFKYPVGGVELPIGAQLVLCDVQGERATLWFRHRLDGPREVRTFTVVGTGQQFPAAWRHVGSYQQSPFVWHVMEVV